MSERFIEWELKNIPYLYSKPRVNEFIDCQTLRHVIGNIDCPKDVDFNVFRKVMEEVAIATDMIPFFTVEQLKEFDFEEIRKEWLNSQPNII